MPCYLATFVVDVAFNVAQVMLSGLLVDVAFIVMPTCVVLLSLVLFDVSFSGMLVDGHHAVHGVAVSVMRCLYVCCLHSVHVTCGSLNADAMHMWYACN